MTNPIKEAVEPRRAAALKHAEEHAAKFVEARRAELEAAGWDLNKVAPEPSSNQIRKTYMVAKNRRAMFSRLTVDANPKAENAVEEHRLSMLRRRNHAVDLVAFSEEGAARFILNAKEMADAEFSSYISKLTAKVAAASESPSVKAELDGGALWSYSYLTVERADGTKETWKTQMIINVSVLGTLFNQWPTRRVK